MNQPLCAAALTESALRELDDALTSAGSPDDFLAQADAVVANPVNRLALPVDFGPPELIRPAKGVGIDAENGPAVFEYVGALDPSNAADPRLWTYLAFGTYRAYMAERWPLDGDNWRSRARNRWLLKGATRGRLVRHGIARLWWVTNLTYDGKCEYPLSQSYGDQYAYARAVFRNEDRVLALFDREAGAMPNVVRAVLEHVQQDPMYASDDYVRVVMKELTLVLGFRDIGVLSVEAIRDLIEEVMPL